MRNYLKILGGLGILCLIAAGALRAAFDGEQPSAASFAEVWRVVISPPEDPGGNEDTAADMAQYGDAENPALPQFSGNLDVLWSIGSGLMKKAAFRTVASKEDYHPYFKKLVHANGICFRGTWEITEPSRYSGYFSQGKTALMIGRISAATSQTTAGSPRAFGFAGKLFPTLDEEEAVPTANFFTVDNLNRTSAPQMRSVALTNEPPADLSGVLNPLKILNHIFAEANINPGVRPLYPVARAGQIAGAAAITPRWMRIRTAPGAAPANEGEADFRAELSAKNFPAGLIFTVDVSDSTKDASREEGWQRLGKIHAEPMVVSFGCDRRLHFPHMPFRDPAE